jgi:hypothetical protein
VNIFVTSPCPIESAKALDNKRVIKMLLESAQMLSCAINENGGKAPYRSSHKNHPCNVWARTSTGNWDWLFEHYDALCQEYTRRTGKIHKSSELKQELLSLRSFIPTGERTAFVNCAANQEKGVNYKHMTDVHKAYQLYLCDRWNSDKLTPKWS